MINDELRIKAAATIINNMLMSSFFSICDVDQAAKAANRNPHCEEYDFLRTMHCQHFSKMPRDLREKIPGLIGVCLGIEVKDTFKPMVVEIALPFSGPESVDQPVKKNRMTWLEKLGLR